MKQSQKMQSNEKVIVMLNKIIKYKYLCVIILIEISAMINAKQSDFNYFIHHINPQSTGGEFAFVQCEKPTEVTMKHGSDIRAVKIANWWNKCQVPEVPYSEILSQLNINSSSIEEFSLEFSAQSKVALTSEHFQKFEALKILILEFVSYNREMESKYPEYLSNSLEPLKQISQLYLEGSVCPVFSQSSEIETLTLRKGSSKEEFGGCMRLKILNLEMWDFNKAKDNYLSHCPVLNSITIYDMSSMSVEVLKNVLSGLKQLRELYITKCYFKTLPLEGILSDSLLLEIIDLSGNGVIEISIPPLPQVTHLNLEFNDINDRSVIVGVLNQLSNLRELNMSNNIDFDMCQPMLKNEVTDLKHEKLEKLFVSLTKTDDLCFENFTALKYLHLGGNPMPLVNFKGIPKSQAKELVVHLTYGEIKEILFDREDYFYMKHLYPSTVELIALFSLNLSCDCEDTWFIKAMVELPNLILTAPRDGRINVTCNNKEAIYNIPLEQIECSKYKCVGNCTCKSNWKTGAVIADCNNAWLETIPNIDNLIVLYASNNHIEEIDYKMLSSLKYLDVSKNNVKRINPGILQVFLEKLQGELKLANNPIACDCDNQELVKLLQRYKEKIDDYDLVACGGDNRLISKLDPEDLCEPLLPPSVIAGFAGVLAVMAITAAAYVKYHREIKVFLYSHGCMFLVRVEELDADLTYDAFISYSHEDEPFVMDTLVPGLESDPHKFKLCLHDRDWIPGEFIPAQITVSVENSRRTIIVMTRNYLTSPWCLLEFRTAHEETLKLGRPRIIVVLLEDITDLEALDPELRSYLKNYTYLKSVDSKFWHKLRYAMPHITHIE